MTDQARYQRSFCPGISEFELLQRLQEDLSTCIRWQSCKSFIGTSSLPTYCCSTASRLRLLISTWPTKVQVPFTRTDSSEAMDTVLPSKQLLIHSRSIKKRLPRFSSIIGCSFSEQMRTNRKANYQERHLQLRGGSTRAFDGSEDFRSHIATFKAEFSYLGVRTKP